jgi:hypothetical protein
MHHDVVGPGQRGREGVRVAEVGLHQGVAGVEEVGSAVPALELGRVELIEIVEDGNLPTLAQKPVYEVTSDEAGAAGDECVLSHVNRSPCREKCRRCGVDRGTP